MTKDFVYFTNCISAKGEDIRDMIDHPKQKNITRETFLTHVDYKSEVAPMEETMGYSIVNDGGLRMANDYMVSYSRSFYKGAPCYYFSWSAIEYIFIDAREIDITGNIIERPKLSRCPKCSYTGAEPRLVGEVFPKHDEDDRQTIYVCKSCGTRMHTVKENALKALSEMKW